MWIEVSKDFAEKNPTMVIPWMGYNKSDIIKDLYVFGKYKIHSQTYTYDKADKSLKWKLFLADSNKITKVGRLFYCV